MSARFLAFDLGAESGRAILGQLDDRVLTLKDVRRFPNVSVRTRGALHWDILRLWHDVQQSLDDVNGTLASVGVDSWGCDYALLGEQGQLLENPYHYRDTRCDGVPAQVFRHVPAERIYATTGIQFLNFNSLFQLYATKQSTPHLLRAATAFLTIPDLLNYWLTGRLTSEYTNATTTQMIDAKRRAWAMPLLEELGLPTHLFQALVEPGTVIGGIRHDVSASLADTTVVAPACHDTGSAFASVSTEDGGAILSSGTWSLLGAEVAAPVISARARELNFTNEGGVGGTTRLLKNIAGLWLLQSCMRRWAESGQPLSYDDLLEAARDDGLAFQSVFDPDHSSFFNPPNMPAAIAAYCRQTGQVEPSGQAACARAILESLALKYRVVLESLEELTGRHYKHLRIVGGGSRNRLLNQLTADATGRTVLAGPVEATALGNIAMQMLATGTVRSLAEARAIVDRSFPAERFDPIAGDRWATHYDRFQESREVMGG